MKYAGPQYILANVTNNCLSDVMSYWIHDKMIQGQPCTEQNKELDNLNSLFHKDVCYNKPPQLSQSVQVKPVDGLQQIYCYGVNITVRKEETQCPNFVETN